MRTFWTVVLVTIIVAAVFLFMANENEKKETELEGYRYDRNELIKSRVKIYYMEKNHRKMVRDLSRCKQGKK